MNATETKFQYRIVDGDGNVLMVYNHFSPYRPNISNKIAIAMFDGEPDLYSVDPFAHEAAIVESINKHYVDDYDRVPDSLTIYRTSRI